MAFDNVPEIEADRDRLELYTICKVQPVSNTPKIETYQERIRKEKRGLNWTGCLRLHMLRDREIYKKNKRDKQRDLNLTEYYMNLFHMLQM